MIAAVDAYYYLNRGASAALVGFRNWSDDHVDFELREHLHRVEPYEPGHLYKRELPCILVVLDKVRHRLETVIIDGYVWLAPDNRRGLGAHLYQALGSGVPVVGVAKSPFQGSSEAQQLMRGSSRKPLYVTAVGMDPAVAAKHVASMHGHHRMPTLLKHVDRLCRSLPPPEI